MISLLALVAVATEAKAEGETAYAVWCSANSTLYFTNRAEALSANGTFSPEGGGDAVTITSVTSGTDVTNANYPGWAGNTAVQTVVFEPSFANVRPTSTYCWFYGFTNLTTIIGITNLNTSEVTNMSSMFNNCQKLASLDLGGFTTSAVTNMTSMFYNCKALASLNLSSFNTANVKEMGGLFNQCSSLQTITLGNNFTTEKVTDMSAMFRNCAALENVDVSTFNTAKVTNMKNMFYGCSSLASLDLRGFSNASISKGRVSDSEGQMSSMFENCSSLETLTLSSSFCSSPVQSLYKMFKGCAKLKNVDFSAFNLSNASYIRDLFDGCSSLETIDLSGTTFINNAYISLDYMFNGCSSLKSLKLPSSSVKASSINYMFAGCSSLESINLPAFEVDSRFGIGVTHLFSGCSSLKSLDLSVLDIQYTSNLSNMFEGCSSLTSLDLSNFYTAKANNMTSMFSGCSQLKDIYISCAWTAYNATLTNNMFLGCESIEGQNGATYDPNSVDGSRATDEGDGYMKTGTDTEIAATGYAIYSADNTTLYFLRSTKLLVPGRHFTPDGSNTPLHMDGVWKDLSNTGQKWNSIASSVTDVVVCPSFANVKPKSLSSWFKDFSKITGITGLKYLNYFRQATSMSSLFSNCTSLVSLDLTDFRTDDVTTMSYMFSGCSSLKDLDLSTFNTSSVTSTEYMFQNCGSLISLDLSSFNTSRVKWMTSMFQNCSKLESIFIYPGLWNVLNVSYSNNMFSGCTAIVGEYGTVYNPSNVDKTCAHANDGGYLRKACLPVVVWCSGNETLYFTKDRNGLVSGSTFTPEGSSDEVTVTSVWSGNKVTHSEATASIYSAYPGWSSNSISSAVKHVVFETPFAEVTPTSTYGWFYYFENLETIDGIVNLNTERVTNMTDMFYNCQKLTTLDVSGFKTAAVTNMKGMFQFCYGLTTLTGLSTLDTKKVTNMAGMFSGCRSLATIDLSNYDTRNVTDMSSMFSGCMGLTGLDITRLDTHNVTLMNGMFQGYPLPTINLSSFDTSNVTDMTCMFYGSKLKTVDMTGWNWNTGKVEKMYQMFMESPDLEVVNMSGLDTGSLTDVYMMFSDCVSLESVDVSGWSNEKLVRMMNMFRDCKKLKNVNLSGFNTAAVYGTPGATGAGMSSAFSGCSSLTTLDLSSFDIRNAGTLAYLFSGCSNLKTVFVGENWDASNIGYSEKMFYNCTSIVGEDGTTYNPDYVDATKAHYGTGGYLRKKQILLGDVNGDGKVTPADAIMILYHYFGVVQTDFIEAAANVNGDENISPADAIGALYIYFGATAGARSSSPAKDTVAPRDPE